MNMNDLLNTELYTQRSLKNSELVEIILSKLDRIYKFFDSDNEIQLEMRRIHDQYIAILPFLLHIGKKENITPWFVSAEMQPHSFDKFVCDVIEEISGELSMFTRSRKKDYTYRTIFHLYLELGLLLGLTPKRIQNIYLSNPVYKGTFKRELYNRRMAKLLGD